MKRRNFIQSLGLTAAAGAAPWVNTAQAQLFESLHEAVHWGTVSLPELKQRFVTSRSGVNSPCRGPRPQQFRSPVEPASPAPDMSPHTSFSSLPTPKLPVLIEELGYQIAHLIGMLVPSRASGTY